MDGSIDARCCSAGMRDSNLDALQEEWPSAASSVLRDIQIVAQDGMPDMRSMPAELVAAASDGLEIDCGERAFLHVWYFAHDPQPRERAAPVDRKVNCLRRCCADAAQ
mmetsp:Transcript_21395/g.49177  ORF Transcript_21395/g.49177 Transcript_21395/m.49177 type:complete len:108 (-) Transcript_21395:53-376(-)